MTFPTKKAVRIVSTIPFRIDFEFLSACTPLKYKQERMSNGKANVRSKRMSEMLNT